MRLTARAAWIAVAIAAVMVGVWTIYRVDPSVTDAILDKYQALEAWTGDPYQTQGEIVELHGLGNYAHDAPSPRSPAAIALQSATIPIDDTTLQWVAVAASLASLVAIFYFSGEISGTDQRLVALLFLAYVVVRPGRLIWWNVTDLAIPSVVASWWRIRHSRQAGVLLGLAAALKLWPALIIAVLAVRRDTNRAGGWAAVTALLATGVGLLIPSVSLEGSIEAMTSASELWGSIPRLPIVLLAVAILVVAIPRSKNIRFGAATVSGLLLSPIAWIDYWLAALPAALFVVGAAWRRLKAL